MSKNYVGIDIGYSTVKMAEIVNGKVAALASAPVPDNLIKDGKILSYETLADVLRDMARENKIKAKACALVLPTEISFVRSITVPRMTVEQLELNLPYEFHDYIKKETNMYYYDYAVVGEERDENGEIEAYRLLAAAVTKEDVENCRQMLKKAGFKLQTAIPASFAYRNVIRAYEAENAGEHPAEYCIVDMGYAAIRMNMYKSDIYETTRIIEFGGASLDALIADSVNVEVHVAAEYKMHNYEKVLELPMCKEFYGKIAVEIMRAINFYLFNNPGSTLNDIYLCGGLATIDEIQLAVRSTIDINVHSINDLIPQYAEEISFTRHIAAVGVTMQ